MARAQKSLQPQWGRYNDVIQPVSPLKQEGNNYGNKMDLVFAGALMIKINLCFTA